jgi:hypothetical protein
MGRKKLPIDYFERTATMQFRTSRDILDKFLRVFEEQKVKNDAAGNKPLYLNAVMTPILERYVKEYYLATHSEELEELIKAKKVSKVAVEVEDILLDHPANIGEPKE